MGMNEQPAPAKRTGTLRFYDSRNGSRTGVTWTTDDPVILDGWERIIEAVSTPPATVESGGPIPTPE